MTQRMPLSRDAGEGNVTSANASPFHYSPTIDGDSNLVATLLWPNARNSNSMIDDVARVDTASGDDSENRRQPTTPPTDAATVIGLSAVADLPVGGPDGVKYQARDIARSLLIMISNNIGQLAYLNAVKHKCGCVIIFAAT